MPIDPNQYRTPGQLIEALLDERRWTKRTLSVVLAMDESKINRLAADRQPMTAEIAVLFEEVFGLSADVFLGLQASFDLAKARITTPADPKRATRAHLHHGLPVADMIRRGWISARDVRDEAVEPELMRFFGTNRLEDVEVLPHAAKKTQVSEPATPAQLAWLHRVRQIAKETMVARYSPQSLNTALPKLKQLLLSAEETRKVPRILTEAGVRFLVVETLPGAKIDGVCFWLDDRSPVVAMTMRFDRIDNFWFVLRHELEHVLCEHGKDRVMLDTDLQGDSDSCSDEKTDEERMADAAAADFCVPKKMMDAFIIRKTPFFHDRDILAFAKMINVHPGLIAGQIRRRANKYGLFHNYLVKVRASVLPNAIVDGWGSVYPVEP
jgi:HTH-type transcriptional regulator/antitoxin HigA